MQQTLCYQTDIAKLISPKIISVILFLGYVHPRKQFGTTLGGRHQTVPKKVFNSKQNFGHACDSVSEFQRCVKLLNYTVIIICVFRILRNFCDFSVVTLEFLQM